MVLTRDMKCSQWQSDVRTPARILFKFDLIFEQNVIKEGRHYFISVLGSLSSAIIAPIVDIIAQINTRHTQIATKPPL